MLYLSLGFMYAATIVGIPLFPRIAAASLYAIHPFGRTIVHDGDYRPRNWVYVAWILAIPLFILSLLAYWTLCLPFILIMGIFYWPYVAKSIGILRIFANPLGFKVIQEAEEYFEARKVAAAVPVVVTPMPMMEASNYGFPVGTTFLGPTQPGPVFVVTPGYSYEPFPVYSSATV
jgi:uncharacterized membrane protein YccF (DUF307 family)